MGYDIEMKIRQTVSKYKNYKIVVNLLMAGNLLVLFYLLLKMDYRLELVFGLPTALLLYVCVIATYVFVFLLLYLFRLRGAKIVANTLSEECDPCLYEACLNRTAGSFFRDRHLCDLALARYYQGDQETAFQILQQIQVAKLKGTYRFLYYWILTRIYFEREMGTQVPQIEQIFRSGMRNNRQDKILFRRFCIANNICRAMENKDYEKAMEFLSEYRLLQGREISRVQMVTDRLIEAKILLGLGEEEAAGIYLKYVLANGGTLYAVREAEQLLGKDAETQETEPENAEVSEEE